MDQGKIPNIESTLWPQATPKKCFISHPPTSENRKAIGRKMFHVLKNKLLKKKLQGAISLWVLDRTFIPPDGYSSLNTTYLFLVLNYSVSREFSDLCTVYQGARSLRKIKEESLTGSKTLIPKYKCIPESDLNCSG